MSFQQILIYAIVGLGLLWYLISLVQLQLTAPLQAGQTPDNYRTFQRFSVATISVALATYVGWIVGIKSADDVVAFLPIRSAYAQASAPTPPASEAVPVADRKSDVKKPSSPKGPAPTTLSKAQAAAAGVYVLSLVLALIFYSTRRDQTDPEITNLAKSLIGFFVGALSVVFSQGAA